MKTARFIISALLTALGLAIGLLPTGSDNPGAWAAALGATSAARDVLSGDDGNDE